MVQFFLRNLRSKSEPVSEANKNETNNPQHGLNRVFIVITILPISRQYIGKCEHSRQS